MSRFEMVESSDGKKKVRLRVDTKLHGESGLLVEAPDTTTIHHVKMALEVHRGINVNNQSLALFRGGADYVELDDVRRLIDCPLNGHDRLCLVPAMRAGPGSGNAQHKSALIQLMDETTSDLLKIMDEHLKDQRPSSGPCCYVLLRRRPNEPAESIEQTEPSQTVDSKLSIQEESGEVSGGAATRTETPGETMTSTDDGSSNATTKSKMEALKAKMEEIRLRRSRLQSINGSGSDTSAVSTAKAMTPTCDQCQDDGNGECPRCAGRFCPQHIARARHSCGPSQRCSVCQELVMVAGDRYRCPQCKNPLCRRHISGPCEQGHQLPTEDPSRRQCQMQ